MSIQIDSLRVAGFRGIKNLELLLPRITVLLGINNSGKTSLLKAFHLAIGDYSRNLSEEDFFIGSDNQRAEQILVDLRIVPVHTNGDRTEAFNNTWQIEFGDKIKSESNGFQYVALRTCARPNSIKGGFEITRSTLEKWPELENWQTEKVKATRLSSRLIALSFVAIEAQRDIFHDLKDRSSFVGRILSNVKYNEDDISALESLIQELNDDAVGKSEDLSELRACLESLHQTFEGSGIAEITPFPKKIRDLSKHFSIHYGEGEGNGTFSMEYHGMGTRSWASMLAVRAFHELVAARHLAEEEPFFPIVAAEEPESHLHPCAQKTLYRQLASLKGQVIVSTHSPYLAAIANQSELRYLKRTNDSISVQYLDSTLGNEERRRLQRELIDSRGEILFSKALVLCEGETEAQALPLLFERYFDTPPFVFGVSFIGVGGSGNRYLPFLTFGSNFSIPVYIFSDGEDQTRRSLKKSYEQVFGETDIDDCEYLTILDDTDFEAYLISNGFLEQVENAIKKLECENFIVDWISKNNGQRDGRRRSDFPPCETCNQPIYVDVRKEYSSSDGYEKALLDILDKNKTKYAPAIADELCKLDLDSFPPKVIELFRKIKSGGAI